MDLFAIGYCIAHCRTNIKWKLVFDNDSLENFMWGLNSTENVDDCFEVDLNVYDSDKTYISQYSKGVLQNVILSLHGINQLIEDKDNFSNE